MSKKFTVFTMVYYGLDLFKQAIESVINQTYSNLQIIIVNNGANEIITQYVNDLASKDNRINIIRYEENIFNWKDCELVNYVSWNDALKHATGEWITHISYDDLMALDFVERMVKLFDENPACTTAIGRSVSMDIDGIANEEELNNRKTNYRPRYMPGHLLALSTLEINNIDYIKGLLHSDPGQLFTIKCDVLRQYGGYHRALDFSQMYGIVPFGITGFDEDAIFYWRRHEGQVGHTQNKIGITGVNESLSIINDNDIKKRWRVFGDEISHFVVKRYRAKIMRSVANHFAFMLLSLNTKAIFRVLQETGHRLGLWYFVPIRLWHKKQFARIGLVKLIKPILQPIINLLHILNNRREFKNRLLHKIYKIVNK